MKREDLSHETQLIKNAMDIVEVVNHVVPLRREGLDLWVGLCPFHNEKTPSFKVFVKTRSYHCFGCGAHGDVIRFLMEIHNLSFRQVFDYLGGRYIKPKASYNMPIDKTQSRRDVGSAYENLPELDLQSIFSIKNNKFITFSPENIYVYTRANGTPFCYILVSRDPKGKKLVLPVSLYEHEEKGLIWAFTQMPDPRILYNLPELIKEPNKPVLLVEGEKCANVAKKLLKNFVVTTWSGGCNAVDKTDWNILENREVFIWPDNDPNGKEAAEKIAAFLQYAEIIPTKEEWESHWDIADEIEAGKTQEELEALILKYRVPKPKIETQKSEYTIPPGLLGDLTQYILDASPVKHTILAIGAASAIMSILHAQKCVTEDYIHPNLYIITLAPSGSGKSFPLGMISTILRNISCDHLISGMPASGPGLISSLHKRRGRAILAIDEFGKIFSSIVSPDVSNYRQDIVTKLLSLFNPAGGEYRDDEYSDRDKIREPRVIRKPNLVLYGTTIPDNFYSAVNMDDTINGFLARLLVLQGVDSNSPYHSSSELTREMPEWLKEALQQWAFDPPNIWVNVDSNENYDFAPMVIPFNSESRKLIYEFRNRMNAIAKESENEGNAFKSSLYRRCYEQASKLALLAREDSKCINKTAVEWAINLVEKSVDNFYDNARQYMHDGYFSKKSKEIERYLMNKEVWVTKTELHNRFRMPVKYMKDITDYLIGANIIKCKEITKKGKRVSKTTTLYQFIHT